MNTSRKRILIFHLNMSFGGVETQLLSLLTGLNPAKYDIHLALTHRQGDLLGQIPSYVTVHDLHCPSGGLVNPAFILQAKRSIDQLKPDIIFSFHSALHVGVWLGTRLSSPRLPVLGGIPGTITPGRLDFIRKPVYKRMTGLVCVSNWVSASLADIYGCAGNSIVIANCTDIQAVTELSMQPALHPWFVNRTGPILVTVGRLIASKGVDFLIRMLANLRRSVDARLLIIGDGPERENLQRLAAEVGVAGEADFLGYQRNPHPFVRQSDLFTFASVSEGLPTVLIDAMICQVPVITTAYPGVDDLVESGKTGIVVRNRKEGAFSEAVYALWNSRDERQRMTHLACEKVTRTFSKERYVQEYETLFDHLN